MSGYTLRDNLSYLYTKHTTTSIPKPPSPLHNSKDSERDERKELEPPIFDLLSTEDPLTSVFNDISHPELGFETPVPRAKPTQAKKTKAQSRIKQSKSKARIKKPDIRFIDDEVLDPTKVSADDLKKVPREVRSLLGPINKLKRPQESTPVVGFRRTKSGRVIVPPQDYWRGQVKKTDAFGNFIEVAEGSPSVETSRRRRRLKEPDPEIVNSFASLPKKTQSKKYEDDFDYNYEDEDSFEEYKTPIRKQKPKLNLKKEWKIPEDIETDSDDSFDYISPMQSDDHKTNFEGTEKGLRSKLQDDDFIRTLESKEFPDVYEKGIKDSPYEKSNLVEDKLKEYNTTDEYRINIKKEPRVIFDDEDEHLDEWNEEQLASLKNAIKLYSPNEPKYWFLISNHVHKKSAAECAVKWMSMGVNKTNKKIKESKKKPGIKSPLKIGDDMTRLKNKKKLRILRNEKEKRYGVDDAFQSPTFNSRYKSIMSMIDDYDDSSDDTDDALKMINATREFHDITTPIKKAKRNTIEDSDGESSSSSSDSDYSYFLDSKNVDRDKNDKYIHRVRAPEKNSHKDNKGIQKPDPRTKKLNKKNKSSLNEAIQLIRRMENEEMKSEWKDSDVEESEESHSQSEEF